MIESKIYDVIKRPVLSEKSNGIEKCGKYVFVVSMDSNKPQIKNAVKKIFNVKVIKVNMINIPGKVKMFKGKRGKRGAYKKAIVTIKDMQKIEFSKGV